MHRAKAHFPGEGNEGQRDEVTHQDPFRECHMGSRARVYGQSTMLVTTRRVETSEFRKRKDIMVAA